MPLYELVPVDEPDGCLGCLVVLIILGLFFGGGTAAVSKFHKEKHR